MMNNEQIGAMEDASECGGNFLDTLGKTDLATLSRDEYMAFIKVVCLEYDDAYERRCQSRDASINEAKSVEPWVPSKTPQQMLRARDLDDEIPF